MPFRARNPLVLVAGLVASLASIAVLAASGASAQTQTVALSLSSPSAARDGVKYGTQVKLTGRLLVNGIGQAGIPVQLERARYPALGHFGVVSTTRTGP